MPSSEPRSAAPSEAAALVLEAGPARAEVAPAQGGALAGLTVGGLPALSTGAGRPEGSPFALALNLLLPFSNRISRPFAFEGRTHALSPNLAGEPFPIHGDAFQRPWTVLRHDGSEAVLRLGDGDFDPFAYEARVVYRLTAASLSAELSLTSRADLALPWGLGFHPWFPRGAGTRVRFAATGCWPQDDRHLPVTPAPVPVQAEWDFAAPAPLPRGWINTAFAGWDGLAEIAQDGAAVPLRLAARGLGTLIVYSPSAEAPFLCLEPVSHPVDAHNLPGQPGLVRLAPGDTISAQMTLTWDPSGPAPTRPLETR